MVGVDLPDCVTPHGITHLGVPGWWGVGASSLLRRMAEGNEMKRSEGRTGRKRQAGSDQVVK